MINTIFYLSHAVAQGILNAAGGETLFVIPKTSTIIPRVKYHAKVNNLTKNSIAMLDKDHHIHLIPAERVIMMSLEHSTIKRLRMNVTR